MKLSGSIEIAAPPEKIWPYLVEPEKILEWYFPLEEFQYTSEQRAGVGTTFYYVEASPVGSVKLNFTVTEWVENRRIAFRMTSGDFLKAAEQSWTVEPTPSGSMFTFDEEGEFPYGLIGKLMALFARMGSQANVRKMLTRLKSLAEA
jgi:uncharacterized protein YndB with AHSA1/START domain